MLKVIGNEPSKILCSYVYQNGIKYWKNGKEMTFIFIDSPNIFKLGRILFEILYSSDLSDHP